MKATPVIVIGGILAVAAIIATTCGAQTPSLTAPVISGPSPGAQPQPSGPPVKAKDTGPPSIIAATSAGRGQGLFAQRCATCHDPAVAMAPSRADLHRMKPEDIVAAMTDGVMQEQAQGLSDTERLAIAAYLTAS